MVWLRTVIKTTPIVHKISGELFGKKHINLTKPHIATLKNYAPPIQYEDFEDMEIRKPKFIPKMPLLTEKPRTMRKLIRLMRGPETVNNFLMYRQYGIQAMSGGRMKASNFEHLRLCLIKMFDFDKVFAVWRIDEPWQPVGKRPPGKRMGMGKSSIHHYVTPVKSGRIILEFGGKIHPAEVMMRFAPLAESLPFKARFVSQKMLDKEAEEEKLKEEKNLNKYTFKYVILNNLGGCNNWLSPYDYEWFGKYK